jgi:hypothetical protein
LCSDVCFLAQSRYSNPNECPLSGQSGQDADVLQRLLLTQSGH